jgi:hypothetical protein
VTVGWVVVIKSRVGKDGLSNSSRFAAKAAQVGTNQKSAIRQNKTSDEMKQNDNF